jgi:hypothetical protein
MATHGCPAHHVDSSVPDQPTVATYQQYTITIPFISDATATTTNAASILGPVPLSDAVPTFGGPVGLAVDGAFIYNDLTSTGHDAVLTELFDACHGHNDELGRYHYHQIPLCLLELLGGTTPPRSLWPLLSSAAIHANGTNLHEWVSLWPTTSSKGPSPLLGWALDGVPIYGPYDETGSLLAWGGDFPNTHYSNTSSRLDPCNGRTRASDGRYVYHLTPTPPYTVGCFRGRHGLGAVTGTALQRRCPSAATSPSNATYSTGVERHSVGKICTLAGETTSREISRASRPIVAFGEVAGVVRTIVLVKVTVGAKTLDNPQHPSYFAGIAGNSDLLCFYLDDVEATAFVMQRGLTYRFFQSETDFLEYPFRFYKGIETMAGGEAYSGADVTHFASSSTYYNDEGDDENENNSEKENTSGDGILRRLVLEFRADALSPRMGGAAAALATRKGGVSHHLTFGSTGGLRMGGTASLRTSSERIVRVTVAPKTLGNKYHPAVMPNASPLGYYFDGIEADSFQFVRGMSYIFDQTMSVSNSGHPLRLYLTNEKTMLYNNDEDVSFFGALTSFGILACLYLPAHFPPFFPSPSTNYYCQVEYPSEDPSVVGRTSLRVDALTPRTHAAATPNRLSYQCALHNRMGGIATIVDHLTGSYVPTSSLVGAAPTGPVPSSTAAYYLQLSDEALTAAFASAPAAIGSPATAVKKDLSICQAFMGDDVDNLCLCYEQGTVGQATPPSSQVAVSICAATCAAKEAKDNFEGTTATNLNNQGFDGTAEVLGWACFRSRPSTVTRTSDETIISRVSASATSAAIEGAVVAAAEVAQAGAPGGVDLARLRNATVFRVNVTHLYGLPQFVIDGKVSPALTLLLGKVYVFQPSSQAAANTLAAYPLRFSTTPDGTNNANGHLFSDVAIVGMSTDSKSVVLAATCSTPASLFYFCPNQKGMGGVISLSGGGTLSSSSPP